MLWIWFVNVAHKFLPHYAYKDYLNWEGKWELIDAILYALSPAPIPRHQAIAGSTHAELRSAIRQARCTCTVYQPLDYKLGEDTVFQPDLSVVCKPIAKKSLDFRPEVVVEILSESTRMKDRNVKYPQYEAEAIPYSVMIDIDTETVEVYRMVDGRYQRQLLDQSKPFEFQLDDCRFELVFDAIWE